MVGIYRFITVILTVLPLSTYSQNSEAEIIFLQPNTTTYIHCAPPFAWFNGNNLVTNITGVRYLFNNGTLFFPRQNRLESLPGNENSSYQCSRLEENTIRIIRVVKLSPNPRSHIRRKRHDMVFLEHFPGQVVNPGATVELWCAVRGALRINWFRDGSPLHVDLRDSSSHLSLGEPSMMVRSSYNISRVVPEDAGLYACEAVSRNNESVIHEARVDTYGPPYIRSLGPIKIVFGTTAVIRCPYYGYPISKIKWERSNVPQIHYERNQKLVKRFSNRRERRSFTDDNEGKLTIPNVGSSENGATYTCTVTSPSNEMAKRSFEIQVMRPPVLDELLNPSNVQEGEIAKIVCSVKSGDGPIFFHWLKDGLPIPVSLKAEEKKSEFYSVLLFKDVGLQHCGVYTCLASNHIAKVNASTELYIKVAPKWMEEPQNTSLVMRRQGIIRCSATGYPQPQVHWMKKQGNNWRPVLELRGSGILSLPNGTLVLDDVTTNDGGQYSCQVENGIGNPLQKYIFITVYRPVTFKSAHSNVTTNINKAVSVICEAFGDHPIKISWSHNGRALSYHHSDRIQVTSLQTNQGATSQVLIGKADVEYAGQWLCEASNAHGSAQHSTFLTVQEPPGPPMDVAVEEVKERFAKIGWRSPIILPLVYSIQYTPHRHLHWDTATIFNVSHVSSQSRQMAKIIDLHPATSYSVRILSIGSAGSSSFTRPISFTTLEEVPSSAPLNIQVVSGPGPGELQISWLPPPAHTFNGVLLGYLIKVTPQISHHSEERATTTKVGPTVDHTILKGLLKSTRYSVTVSCYNGAGIGPPSQLLFRDTPEGAPEISPEEVECSAISSSSLRVAWKPLPHHLQGGAMLGYTIHYIGADGINRNITSVHSSVQMDGLNKYTNYTIWVTGYSRIGQGPVSHSLLCTTMEDLPSAPSDIKVLVATSNSLVISWLPPLHPNGKILHYTVYLKASQGGGAVQTYKIKQELNEDLGNQKTMSHSVRGLEQGRKYEAWVTAATILGEGEPTRNVMAEPTDRVVASVSSLGRHIVIGRSASLKLYCEALGNPQPRTVWYHNSRVITHHPSFSLNADNSLFINEITPSLEGNYTCVAKNLFGWDSVSYIISVISPPPPPRLRASPDRRGLILHWAPPNHTTPILGYTLSWREENGDWIFEDITGGTTVTRKLEDLGCGKQYEVKLIAHGTMGPSSPAIAFSTTLGSVMVAPLGTEWIWSNSSHMSLQLDTWLDGDCGPVKWSVDYRPISTRLWLQSNILPSENGHNLVIGGLQAAKWYQLRVTATNLAGPVSALYTIATRNEEGDMIGPPFDPLDINILVMGCSCVLLLLCVLVCIFVAIQKHRHRALCGTSSENISRERSSQQLSIQRPLPLPHNCPPLPQRHYTSPLANRKTSISNSDMFEISPYAQCSMGFQTFKHADNLDRTGYVKGKLGIFSTETSFQMGSDTDDSDSLKSGTISIAKQNMPPGVAVETNPQQIDFFAFRSKKLHSDNRSTPRNETCRVQYHKRYDNGNNYIKSTRKINN